MAVAGSEGLGRLAVMVAIVLVEAVSFVLVAGRSQIDTNVYSCPSVVGRGRTDRAYTFTHVPYLDTAGTGAPVDLHVSCIRKTCEGERNERHE